MLIAHVAPVFSTVPPVGYGGVERVVEELAAAQLAVTPELDVVVIASSDSRPTARLAGTVPSIRSRVPPLDLDATFAEVRRHYEWAFGEARRLGVDVVHLHGPWGLDPGLPELPAPAVASIYDDTSRADVRQPLTRPRPGVHLVANSERSRAKAPEVPWFATILEGVMVDRYPVAAAREPYCCFVGELVPDKGLDIAVRVARAAAVPLKVVGRPRMLDVPDALVAEQARYLEWALHRHVDGTTVAYLGELGEDRLPVMAAATALVAPMRIEEPFGRAMAEAMACGTPVVTFRRGSAPEIVADGVSGFLVDTEAEMVDALRAAASLPAGACRDHARRVLDVDRTARAYAAVYRSVLDGAAGPRPGDHGSDVGAGRG